MTYGMLVSAATDISAALSSWMTFHVASAWLFIFWNIGMFIGFNLLIRAFLAFLACQQFLLNLNMVLELYI